MGKGLLSLHGCYQKHFIDKETKIGEGIFLKVRQQRGKDDY